MIEWTTPTGRVVSIRATCKDCGEELVEVERATCANDDDVPHPHARCISPTCFVRMPKGWAACLIVTLPEEDMTEQQALNLEALDVETRRKLWRACQLMSSIYDRHPCGCCWHITLDDGNCDDDSIEFCVAHTMLEADPYPQAPCRGVWPHDDCRELGPIMRSLSVEQRAAIHMDLYDRLAREFGQS